MHINNITIIITMINFVGMLLVFKYFFYKPINDVIGARQNEIDSTIKVTKENQEKAEALRLENEQKLREAKHEGKSIVENYKVKAEKVSTEIVDEAKQEAQLIVERARKEAIREKEKAETEIKTQVVDLAVLLSSKALEKSIDEEAHKVLIRDFIAKVGI